MTTADCPFCRIITRELDASVVHESAAVLAFMDIDPVTAGHVLVVPKAHLPTLADLAGDGFRISARWGSNPARDELDRNAEVIRAELA